MNDAKPTPGSRLKAERELRGLSTQKAADEMHLDAWVIDALEAGDYARIGPTVYAKGHLRKYASLLGLPVAEIMSDFEPQQSSAPSRDASSIPVGSRHGATETRSVSPGQAAAGVAAVFLLVVLMWWQPWHQRSHPPTGSAPPSAVPPPPEQGTAANVDSSDDPISAQDYAPGVATPGAAAPGIATPRVVTPAAVAPAAAASRSLAAAGPGGGAIRKVSGSAADASGVASGVLAPGADGSTPGAGRARLRLSFSSDAWVDVRDALGNRAYAGNGSANTVKTIAGNAPLHVYLRSANGVQLEINGRAVAIGPQFFSGDVARFEAGADGVLRRDAPRDAAHPAPAPARPPG